VVSAEQTPSRRFAPTKARIELEDGGFIVVAGLIQLSNGRSYDAILLRIDAEGRVGE